MACSNCFNGCADVISDQCVRYTGIDIPGLNIHNGDNLLTVENAITNKILTLMDGTGIIPKLDSNDVCEIVQGFLPCCPPFDLNAVLTALIKSICTIEARLLIVEGKTDVLRAEMDNLNANYIIPACLVGTSPSTDTHDMLQITMNKLCAVELDLHTNYTPTDGLDEIIQSKIVQHDVTTKYSARMVPWVPVPIFFIPNGAFDLNGAGSIGGAWEDIYICNGTSYPNIPDLRGRVVVGSTAMAPAPFDAAVNPATSGNPVWAIGEKNGVNTVPLTVANLPAHGHTATVRISDPGHKHTFKNYGFSRSADFDNDEQVWRDRYITDETSTDKTGLVGGNGILVTNPPQNVFVDIGNSGTDTPHNNIQPGIGAYYIMHIPKP